MGSMRRLLILILIVLLPLRGWAGNLMSVQMATSGVVSVAVEAAAMPPGCPMQAHSETDGSHPHGGMKNCVSCGLCIPLAELACVRLDIATFAGHVQPVIGDADFESISLAPTVKPPIS